MTWKVWLKGPRLHRGRLSQQNQMPKLSRKPYCIFKILWHLLKSEGNDGNQIRFFLSLKNSGIRVHFHMKVNTYAAVAQRANPISNNSQPDIYRAFFYENYPTRTKQLSKVSGAAKIPTLKKMETFKQKELIKNTHTTTQIITDNPKASTKIK